MGDQSERQGEVLRCVKRGGDPDREFGNRTDAKLYASAFEHLMDEGYMEWHGWNLRPTEKGLKALEGGLR